jgi:hypothetical protein
MKLLTAIFPLLFLPLDALAGRCPAAPVQIENAIRQHITRLGATEYCDARRVKTENGITLAIYTAEGACAGQNSHDEPGTCSNNWVRYMVALSGPRVTPPVEVGGKERFFRHWRQNIEWDNSDKWLICWPERSDVLSLDAGDQKIQNFPVGRQGGSTIKASRTIYRTGPRRNNRARFCNVECLLSRNCTVPFMAGVAGWQ